MEGTVFYLFIYIVLSLSLSLLLLLLYYYYFGGGLRWYLTSHWHLHKGVCQTCSLFLIDWRWRLVLYCIYSIPIKFTMILLKEMPLPILYFSCTLVIIFVLCSPPAIERLSSGLFQEVIITNTIPVSEQNYFPQLTILSVANLLGETIWRVHDDCSVSSIFQ